MITLTESAATRIADQISKNNAIALRFAAKESGCSGYSYVMDLADKIEDSDSIFESYDVNRLCFRRSKSDIQILQPEIKE